MSNTVVVMHPSLGEFVAEVARLAAQGYVLAEEAMLHGYQYHTVMTPPESPSPAKKRPKVPSPSDLMGATPAQADADASQAA
jgi:hypothetical protein